MPDKSERVNLGIGMPHWLYLRQFGDVVFHAFGMVPMLVGSATVTKQWRDVDVRLILLDEEYAQLVGDKPGSQSLKWSALCMAFSELGKRMTGLPIDFQIMQMTNANELFPHQIRCALMSGADYTDAPKPENVSNKEK